MRWLRLSLVSALLIPGVLISISCGSSSSLRTPPPPSPSDPWYGTVGNVLVQENERDGTVTYMWVGFSSGTNWQLYLTAQHQCKQEGCAGGWFWIGGPVVVDADAPLGFYFDPNNTDAAMVAPTVQQTALWWIRQDPACFANNPWPRFVWLAPLSPVSVRTDAAAMATALPNEICPGQ